MPALPQSGLAKKRKVAHDTNILSGMRGVQTHPKVPPNAPASSNQGKEKLYLRFPTRTWTQVTGQSQNTFSPPTPPPSKRDSSNTRPPPASRHPDSYFPSSAYTSPLTSFSGSNSASPAIVPGYRECSSSLSQLSLSSLSSCTPSPMDAPSPHHVEHPLAQRPPDQSSFPPEPLTPDSPLSPLTSAGDCDDAPHYSSPPPSPQRQGFNTRPSIIPPSLQRRRSILPMQRQPRTKSITRPSHLPDCEDEPSGHIETSAQDSSNHTFGQVQHPESYVRVH